jgi:perosamine synthetase
VNAGEGGMFVTDDPELAARAVIMSGAYEYNWKKHPGLQNSYHHWQNRLPLYNVRMQNLSAAVIRPQLPLVAARVARGLANHDHMADLLNATVHFAVPPALAPEDRAPDSIQFRLVGDWTDDQARRFESASRRRGAGAQVFGLSPDNARAFWNWQFLGETPDLPKTRAMLMRTCDLRLPARLTADDIDFLADALISAADEARAA